MNQKILFQKAEIKKNYNEDIHESSLKIKAYFEDYDNQFFNHCLSSTFMTFNEKILDLKHQLVEDLRIDALKLIEEKIKSNYPKYLKYLFESIEKISYFMDIPPIIVFFFNSRDFKYFEEKSNLDIIRKYFKNPIEIRESSSDFIGGFRIQTEGNLTYNNVMDDQISKKTPLFQITLSRNISEQEVNEIKKNFEEFIEDKRVGIHLIEDYLNKYE